MAAWNTFWLIVRNAGRFTVISGIGFLLMFVGKATIVVLSGWFAYLIIMNAAILKEQVYSPAFPIVIVVLIAYLLASIFLSLFSFSSTTILHCYIIDSELSAKSGKGPQHRPESLAEFIEMHESGKPQGSN